MSWGPSGAAGGDGLARVRRIIAGPLRKAAVTQVPHEATACREMAEALRAKYVEPGMPRST